MRVRVASSKDFDDVANGRAVERGHDADLAGQRRERALACRIEETLGLKPPLQLIEGKLQRAEAMRLHALAHDLILTFRLVYADAPAHDDMQTVFRFELQRADVRLEHDRFDLGARIFQREVEVAGVPEAAVGNFCFHPDFGVSIFQNAADVRRQVANGEDGSLALARDGSRWFRFRLRVRAAEEIKLRAHAPLVSQTDSIAAPMSPFRSPRPQQSECR